MVILVDTNVLMDVIVNREPYAEYGKRILEVTKECFSSEELDVEDVEEYLKNYDTNWDKYMMSIRKCIVFVKDPDKESELREDDDLERLVRWYRE